MSLNVLTHGGGAGGEFASIFVTGLDESSTVTATKDGKTVQGKWNSTENRFEITKIKEYGIYTVKATNGENTATQDVLVDAAVEYAIFMDLYKLWLYREGDECEDVTGGFSAYARKNWSGGISTAPTLTKNVDSMSIALNVSTSDNHYRGIVSTNDLIHIEGYEKLKFHCPTISVANAANMVIAFYVTTSIVDDFGQYVLKAYDVTSGTNATDVLVEMDVSGISADAYVVINMIGWTSCTVDKIWLE